MEDPEPAPARFAAKGRPSVGVRMIYPDRSGPSEIGPQPKPTLSMSRSARIGLGAVLLVLGFGLTSGEVQRSMHGDVRELEKRKESRYSKSFWGKWNVSTRSGGSRYEFAPGNAEVAGWITAALGAGLLAVGLGSARRTDESSS